MLKFDFEIVLRNRFTGALSYLVVRGIIADNQRLAFQYVQAFAECEIRKFETITAVNPLA